MWISNFNLNSVATALTTSTTMKQRSRVNLILTGRARCDPFSHRRYSCDTKFILTQINNGVSTNDVEFEQSAVETDEIDTDETSFYTAKASLLQLTDCY